MPVYVRTSNTVENNPKIGAVMPPIVRPILALLSVERLKTFVKAGTVKTNTERKQQTTASKVINNNY